MKKRFDIIALGELLVDMAECGLSEQGNMTFEACPGGAPCNVLALLNKAGHSTAFIGKVGDDFMGHMLADTITKIGINTEGLIMDPDVKTTLAFVHKKADGDRDFSFYRKPGADMMLRADEVNEELIASSGIFHFGTLSMTDEGVKEATKKAVALARENGVTVSFDPNLREPLWDSLSDAKEAILWGMKNCDILKISDNEVEFVTGISDMKEGFDRIREITNAKIIFVTLGKDGSMACCGKGETVSAAGVPMETVVDTTGAGDTFFGCALHYIIEYGMDLSNDKLLAIIESANKTAAQITQFRGALKVMPDIIM